MIQQGTTARQRVVTAPLSEIAAEVQRQGIHTPAMTVIGDVVSLRQQLSWFGMDELSGKKVLLTGTPAYTRKAAEQLRSCGAEPVEVSLIYPKASSPDMLKALPWQSYTWAVLTSANGVEQLFASLKQSHVDLRRLLHLRFAAIGNGTAQALAEYGIFVDCVPEHFDSRSLAEALIPQLTMQDRVLLLRAENGSVILPQLLEQAGKAVDTVPLYRVQTDLRKRELLLQELADTDYVFLASASAARAFAEMTAGTETAAKLISIGNATTKAAETAGLSVAETAVQSDIAGMIACIRKENEV